MWVFKAIFFLFQELENVQAQLSERNNEIHLLKEQLAKLPQPTKLNYCHSSISVQSVMNRMEREAESYKMEIERLTAEKDEIRMKLQIAIDSHHHGQRGHTQQTAELRNTIKQLESEKRTLQQLKVVQAPNNAKIARMEEEADNYMRKIEEKVAENCALKTSLNQLKYVFLHW